MNLIAQQRAALIREEAINLGFDDVGFVSAEVLDKEAEFLEKWLDRGFHGGMDYMNNNVEKRNDPTKLVEGAKSVIVVLQNYNPPQDGNMKSDFKLARYAYGRDYHKVVKNRLKKLMSFIQSQISEEAEGRFFVDSAPVSERSLAVRAGLGWRGKNTNLLHHQLGSYVFIGEIILNIELPSGVPLKDACGSCTRCINACPTGALIYPYHLDSRKCISYLTIENKGEIPSGFADKFNGWIFGCDICQEVCPWNGNAPSHHEPDFNLRSGFQDMSTQEWLSLDIEAFDQISQGSPVRRAGYHGLMRNLTFVKKPD